MGKTKTTAKSNFKKTPRKSALKMATRLSKKLESLCETVTIVGSIRRGRDMVGDIDIVVIPKNIENFVIAVKGIIEFEYGGNKKIFGMFEGRPINIFTTTKDSYGACVYQTTGPADYNIHMRSMAKRKGMKINEYGLWDRENNTFIAGKSEEDMFAALNMEYKDPENRRAPMWARKVNIELT